jgi:anti-anti-sigma factor
MSGHPPKSGSLQISSALEDGTVRVSLEGELDLSCARQLEARLTAIDEQAPARVLIDLSALEFIDSSGLRMLLLADTRAREHGYELTLSAGPEPVQRVFEMTGALDILRFES